MRSGGFGWRKKIVGGEAVEVRNLWMEAGECLEWTAVFFGGRRGENHVADQGCFDSPDIPEGYRLGPRRVRWLSTYPPRKVRTVS